MNIQNSDGLTALQLASKINVVEYLQMVSDNFKSTLLPAGSSPSTASRESLYGIEKSSSYYLSIRLLIDC